MSARYSHATSCRVAIRGVDSSVVIFSVPIYGPGVRPKSILGREI